MPAMVPALLFLGMQNVPKSFRLGPALLQLFFDGAHLALEFEYAESEARYIATAFDFADCALQPLDAAQQFVPARLKVGDIPATARPCSRNPESARLSSLVSPRCACVVDRRDLCNTVFLLFIL